MPLDYKGTTRTKDCSQLWIVPNGAWKRLLDGKKKKIRNWGFIHKNKLKNSKLIKYCTQVTDPNSDLPLLVHSGFDTPEPMISPSNQLVLTFTSDYIVNQPGFEISYRIL